MRNKQLICGLSVVLIVLMAAGIVFAQQPTRGQRGQAGQRGQGGMRNMDPAQMQEMQQRMQDRMMQGLQEQMGLSDAEMTAIKPRITKVMALRQELRGSMFRGMMGGRGGNRGNRGGQQDGANLKGLAKIQNELNTLLQKDGVKAAEIKPKLTEYRKAREKIQQNLAAAQANLLKVLTVKQEALMVMRGYCD
jgi:hypothetical protein